MIETHSGELKNKLTRNTKFGIDTFIKPKDHKVLDHELFSEIRFLKSLKDKAYQQIGTSGGGNHFVEFGIVDITDEGNEFGLATGKYLSLLSHSGSRGFGAKIAQHFTKIAQELCPLPKVARHLAWLDLDTEEGQEYWLSMNLAGEYASACHQQIHERIARSLHSKPIVIIENHHNFAWKEKSPQGQDIIVHRKGATPAGKGVLGVIPGSMTAPGFIVRGKGNMSSLSSAAHGAGRAISRKKAKAELDINTVSSYLKEKGVELIGASLDEAPMAYKNIYNVMDAQSDLVEIVGTFLPKIVRMCGNVKFREADS
jgi:tRNA-splicing ligase RtcB